jgi:hypothetical protein
MLKILQPDAAASTHILTRFDREKQFLANACRRRVPISGIANVAHVSGIIVLAPAIHRSRAAYRQRLDAIEPARIPCKVSTSRATHVLRWCKVSTQSPEREL